MADREQSSKPEMEQKPQRDMAGKTGQSHVREGNLPQDRQRAVKPGGTVGRDVPDESKEHHTEIAVEAGRKGAAERRERR